MIKISRTFQIVLAIILMALLVAAFGGSLAAAIFIVWRVFWPASFAVFAVCGFAAVPMYKAFTALLGYLK